MIQLYLQLLDTEKEKADFELLYERYRRLMHWVAKGILHDDELAEDAVHEAFLRVIKNFHKIHEISCPQTRNFVVIIVRNAAISMLAKEKKQTHKFAASEPEDAEHGLKYSSATSDVISENDGLDWESITNGIDETTAALMHKELYSIIYSLPNWAAEVLLLSAVYGFTLREISAVCGISEAAARKRIQRARNLLTEKLKESKEDD